MLPIIVLLPPVILMCTALLCDYKGKYVASLWLSMITGCWIPVTLAVLSFIPVS